MEANCPDISILRRYRAGSITPDEQILAESHMVQCSRCRQQLIALLDAARETQIESAPNFLTSQALGLAGQREKRSFATFRRFAPVALAAVLVLAVGISFFLYRDQTAPPTTDLRRSDGTAGAFSLTNPPHGSTLQPGLIEFRWQDATPDARYEFTLTDEKGDIVFQDRNARSPSRLDTGAMKLLPGRRYYWSVTARLSDGTRRESPVASFTLK